MGVPDSRLSLTDAYRFAQASSRVDLVARYEIPPDIAAGKQVAGGTVTFDVTTHGIKVQATSASGDEAILQTHRYVRQRAGSGLRARLVLFHLDNGQTNQRRQWGVGDDNDGAFFQLDSSTIGVVYRTSATGAPVDVVVAQSAWSEQAGRDMALSSTLSKVHAYEIVFYDTETRFYIDGTLVHTRTLVGAVGAPATKQAALPLRVRVVNLSAATAGGIALLTASAVLEDAFDLPGLPFALTATKAVTTEALVVALRPAATYLTFANRQRLVPRELVLDADVACDVRVYRGASLSGGPTWVPAATGSAAEKDTADTFASGVLVKQASLDASSALVVPLPPELELMLRYPADAPDVLAITAVAVTGTANVRASLSWVEER